MDRMMCILHAGMDATAWIAFDFATIPGSDVVHIPVVNVLANFSQSSSDGISLRGTAKFPVPCEEGNKVVLSGGMVGMRNRPSCDWSTLCNST